MALDELHARRLAAVVTICEGALERLELLLRGVETSREASSLASRITAEQIHHVRANMEHIRRQLKEAVERFSIRRHKPEARQVLAAELSTLWVVLENATPRRMKGYGKEFAPTDKADWENLIQGLLHDVEQIRKIAGGDESGAEAMKHREAERR